MAITLYVESIVQYPGSGMMLCALSLLLSGGGAAVAAAGTITDTLYGLALSPAQSGHVLAKVDARGEITAVSEGPLPFSPDNHTGSLSVIDVTTGIMWYIGRNGTASADPAPATLVGVSLASGVAFCSVPLPVGFGESGAGMSLDLDTLFGELVISGLATAGSKTSRRIVRVTPVPNSTTCGHPDVIGDIGFTSHLPAFSDSAFNADNNHLYLEVVTDDGQGGLAPGLAEVSMRSASGQPAPPNVTQVMRNSLASGARQLAWSSDPDGQPALLSLAPAAAPAAGFVLKWFTPHRFTPQPATVVPLDDGGRGLNVQGGKGGTVRAQSSITCVGGVWHEVGYAILGHQAASQPLEDVAMLLVAIDLRTATVVSAVPLASASLGPSKLLSTDLATLAWSPRSF